MKSTQAFKAALLRAGIKCEAGFIPIPTEDEEKDSNWKGDMDERSELSLDDERKCLVIDVGHLDHIDIVASSPSKRQVVLSLQEPPREEKFSLDIELTRKLLNMKSIDEQNLMKLYASHTGLNLPAGTQYSLVVRDTWGGEEAVIDIKSLKSFPKSHRFSITTKTTGEKTFFLVGFDEKHMFISSLPQPVKTVKEAQKILIPKFLRNKDYIRQGEHLFVKATPAEVKLVMRNLDDSKYNTYLSNSNADETDHHCSCIVQTDMISIPRFDKNEKLYYFLATGFVSHSRHEKLFLDGWYFHFANTETPGDGSSWD